MNEILGLGPMLVLAVVIGTVPAAQAANRRVVAERQANQERRIHEGVRKGQINPREAQHLQKREAKIQADKKKALADGRLTPAEREKLRHEQNVTSVAINHARHNGR